MNEIQQWLVKESDQPLVTYSGRCTPSGYATTESQILHTTAPIAVSVDHSEHAIWGSRINAQFRLWHDLTHREFRVGFSICQELRLADLVRDRYAHLSHESVLTLAIEIEAHTLFFAEFGKFPDDGGAFHKSIRPYCYGLSVADAFPVWLGGRS